MKCSHPNGERFTTIRKSGRQAGRVESRCRECLRIYQREYYHRGKVPKNPPKQLERAPVWAELARRAW